MTDPIERDLVKLCAVDDAELQRLEAATRQRLEALPRRRDVRWLWLAAVAVVGVTLFLRTHGTAELVIARTAPPPPSRDEPPGLGEVCARSDAVVHAKVVAVDAESVRLEVLEVLAGELPDRVARDDGAPPVSCHESLAWTAGETCLLCVHRDPERGVFAVTEWGSGKHSLPVGGWLELDHVRLLLGGHPLPAPVLAALIEKRGPQVRFELEFYLRGFERPELPVAAPIVQRALAGWASSAALDAVALPDLRGLFEMAGDEVVAGWSDAVVSALHDRYDGLSVSDAYGLLRLLARRGEPWTRDRIDERLEQLGEQLAASPRSDALLRHVWNHTVLLCAFDRELGLDLLWERYGRLQEWRYGFDAGDALLELAGLDRARALAELAARTREQLRAGRSVWLDVLLLLSDDPATLDLLRQVLSAGAIDWQAVGYSHDPIEALRRADQLARLDAVRDLLHEQIARRHDSIDAYLGWLELYLARFRDVGAAMPHLRHWARAAGVDSGQRLRLLETVERATGRKLLRYRNPTVAEIEAAARRL